jgi:hypothetical protein
MYDKVYAVYKNMYNALNEKGITTVVHALRLDKRRPKMKRSIFFPGKYVQGRGV